MQKSIQLVLVYVVLVQGGSLTGIGLSGLGDATHTHHRYHTTNICHNVVLGSYWLTTSLYSIVPGLGGPSQSLVTSQSYLAFYISIMPNPAEEEGARASNIQLVIKYPSFSWEGNQYENFKTFKSRTTILMEGPYKNVQEMDKVAAILGWLGDKGFNLYVTVLGHSPLSRPVAWRRSSSPIGLGYRCYASTHPLNTLQMAAPRAAI